MRGASASARSGCPLRVRLPVGRRNAADQRSVQGVRHAQRCEAKTAAESSGGRCGENGSERARERGHCGQRATQTPIRPGGMRERCTTRMSVEASSRPVCSQVCA